jgi:carboxypeptidase C (cathepsin A)
MKISVGWNLRCALLACLALAAPALAQDAPDRHQRPEAARQEAHVVPFPPDAVTQHTLGLAGRSIPYTATAGTLTLTDGQGQAKANIFYVSFLRTDVKDPAHRPVTYLFNGGPGAASAYLDIGAIGPRVLDFGAQGSLPPQNDHVVDNSDSWLPFTDLVFIDPVGTGYSRALGDPDAAQKQFWGVKQDLATLGEIIRLHLTRAGRIGSPVYLVGESYGGFRAARLAYDLAGDQGLAPAGIIMISPVIEFALMNGGPMDPLPSALRLPSYAAAHDPAARDEAERFALHDYLPALAAGNPPAEIYATVARLTGLDQTLIARWHGLIPLDAYLKDARHDGRVVSRYDATVSGPDPDPWGRERSDDPVLDGTIAPFTSAFLAYVRDELGFKTDLPFVLLSHEVARHWDWRGNPRSQGASDALNHALAIEPKLKVMIAHGLADLQTPYMMSRYVRAHMPDGLGERVTLKLYEGGHMLYLHSASRAHLHGDAEAFYGASAAE